MIRKTWATKINLVAFILYFAEPLRSNGKWEFAICVADKGKILGETTIISPRVFVSKPSNNLVNGYPLESIQIDPETEIYISDMSQDEQNRFWQKVIGKQLCEFVQSIL